MLDTSFIKEQDHITGEKFFSLNIPNVFCNTVESVHNFLLKDSLLLDKDFIVLTHNGDWSVTQELLNIAKQNPRFKLWYGQNVNCSDSKIQSIPIGLENSMYFPQLKKREKLVSASQRSKKQNPTKLIYMNFSLWTNPQARSHCYNTFKNCSWVTNDCSHSVVQENYSIWLEQVLDHHYVLCPRGNGIDTHRLWETLYAGRIPVVLKEHNTKYYENLPILFVDDWSDLNIDFLNDRIEYFSDSSNFNMQMLKFSWWENIIRSASI
jgi:hypothetical protein